MVSNQQQYPVAATVFYLTTVTTVAVWRAALVSLDNGGHYWSRRRQSCLVTLTRPQHYNVTTLQPYLQQS